MLLNDLRPALPEVLGPQLQQLLLHMWSGDPAERPHLASVLDALDLATAAGAEAFVESARETFSCESHRSHSERTAASDESLP